MSTYTWIFNDASGDVVRTEMYSDGDWLVDVGGGLARPEWLDEVLGTPVDILPKPGGTVPFEVNPWLLHEDSRQFAAKNNLTLTTDYEPKTEDMPASVRELFMGRYGTVDPDEIQKVIADPDFEPPFDKDGNMICY